MARTSGVTAILGAGPAGLAAALGLTGCNVLIIAPTLPGSANAPRVDMVPAAFLAFLLELGVHPTQLGVSDLHDGRIMAWGSASPETVQCNAMAHVERPALELALLAAVERLSGVQIVSSTTLPSVGPNDRLIDATGRRTVSATEIIGLQEPWVARVFSQQGQFDKAAQMFRMAALPAGYLYRLATPRLLTIGVVLSRSTAGMPAQDLEEYVRAAGAAWLLAGVGPLTSVQPGKGGIASLQWTHGPNAVRRVGDAALARDSLSAQGLSAGLSDAVSLVREARDSEHWQCRRDERLQLHQRNLLQAMQSSRFRAEIPWQRYAHFLKQSLIPPGNRAPDPPIVSVCCTTHSKPS
jgi:hypothetical protein